MLKRKNEEESAKTAKRVALDAEALDEDGISNNSIELEAGNGASSLPEVPTHLKRVSSHKMNDEDPTYIHFRMLCQVKEASLVVGKGGETIKHIKEVTQTRINVSENIRGVPERVIHVMGSAELVAKAFGLIARAIVNEEEDKPSGPGSRPLQLQLLVQHQMIGYVIGKQGSRFREIEDTSASKLSASPSPLPFSTDRVLTVSGVADALHIAVYYIAQTILDNKANVNTRPIFYDPAKVQPMMMGSMGGIPQLTMGMGMGMGMNGNAPLMSYGSQFISQFDNVTTRPTHNQTLSPSHQQQLSHFGHIHPGHQGQSHRLHPNDHVQQRPTAPSAYMQQGPLPIPVNPHTQDIFIPDEFVGTIIGKSGKNIKQLKDMSGSKIIIADAEKGQSERKITLIGSAQGNQNAVYLINERIELSKKSNEQRVKREQNLLDKKDGE